MMMISSFYVSSTSYDDDDVMMMMMISFHFPSVALILTYAVDLALKANYLSIYVSSTNDDDDDDDGIFPRFLNQ